MTRTQNDAPRINAWKIAGVALLGMIAVAYLGGCFLLLMLKLSPVQASPLTIARYVYYYGAHPAVRPKVWGALGLATLIVGGMALLVFWPKRRSLHGDARWATVRDVRKAGLYADYGIILGAYRKRYLMLPGQTGVILAAPPRSGKGVSCVIPNLLSWPGSVLVLDIKKENWTLTSGYRSLFSDVYLFDPFSEDGRTARWNPFTYVSENPYLRIDGIQRIATMLCQEAPGSDPFWVKSSRAMFVGIALYLFERRDYEREINTDANNQNPIPEVPVTVGEVLRQALAADEEGFSKHWIKIIQGWAALKKPLSAQCVALMMDIVNLAPQTASSVRKTFTSQLDLWLNPLLDMATSASDFDLRDLRKKKMGIYLGIKPRDFERLQVVMNLFFQQAIGEQTAELPEANPALKHQLLVVLDEFTAVGRLPILLNSIAFIPGYNVRTLMVIQTPSQLDEVYGQNGRKVMLKTLAARVIFPPNDIEDARNVSEELGFTTVKSHSRTIPGALSGGKRNPSTSVSDQRRALMLPQEVKEMPTDRQLLFVEHVLPIKCHKIRYYEDKVFLKRLLPAPGIKRQTWRQNGDRSDDHFALWQELLTKHKSIEPAAAAQPTPVVFSTPLSSPALRGELNFPPAVASRVFSLDFSNVALPPGRYLTSSEITSSVDSFIDDYEALSPKTPSTSRRAHG